jgi:hypothetical protein
MRIVEEAINRINNNMNVLDLLDKHEISFSKSFKQDAIKNLNKYDIVKYRVDVDVQIDKSVSTQNPQDEYDMYDDVSLRGEIHIINEDDDKDIFISVKGSSAVTDINYVMDLSLRDDELDENITWFEITKFKKI